MNNRRLFFLIGLLLLCAVFSYALGSKEKKDSVIRAEGLVRLVGSDIFPEIVISGSNGQWYIAKDEAHLLHDLQQRAVTVEGTETVKELRSGSGILKIKRRELSNIKIIKVE